MPGAMPQNHARELRERRPLSRRQKQLWTAISTLAVVIAVVVVVLSAKRATPAGCLNSQVPGPTGAVAINQCGAAAREACRTLQLGPGFSPADRPIIAEACRAAHIPVGRS